jgi:hypothetical protein
MLFKRCRFRVQGQICGWSLALVVFLLLSASLMTSAQASSVSMLSCTFTTCSRVAFTSVSIVIRFQPTNPLPSGGSLTFAYPTSLFLPPVSPTVPSGASNTMGLTLSCSAIDETKTIMTTENADISAGAAFQVTISGLTFGTDVPSKVNVSMRTSVDNEPANVIAVFECQSGMYDPSNDAAVKLSLAGSSVWNTNGYSVPLYDNSSQSWIFDRALSNSLTASPKTFNTETNGITITAVFLFDQTQDYVNIVEISQDFQGSSNCLNILTLDNVHWTRPQVTISWAMSCFPGGAKAFDIRHLDLDLEPNTWYVLTAVYYALNYSAKIYLNGALRQTSVAAYAPGPWPQMLCKIGRSQFRDVAPFSGRMRFVAVHDRSLSHIEILHLHAVSSALVGYPSLPTKVTYQ